LSDDRNFEWAVATGERAFAYLKQLHTAPVPRNYELFFTYAAGYDQELNDAIRDAVFAHASLPEEDVERLLTAHFPQHRLNQKVGEVGAQVAAELNQVVDTIHSVSRSSEDFGHSLEQVAEELKRIATPGELRSVVDSLHKVTQQMAENSRTLAKRAVNSKTLIQGLHHVLEMVRVDSLTDGLTGVANRRRFDQALKMETTEAAHSGAPLEGNRQGARAGPDVERNRAQQADALSRRCRVSAWGIAPSVRPACRPLPLRRQARRPRPGRMWGSTGGGVGLEQ